MMGRDWDGIEKISHVDAMQEKPLEPLENGVIGLMEVALRGDGLLTLNQRVQGSSPCAPTKAFRWIVVVKKLRSRAASMLDS